MIAENFEPFYERKVYAIYQDQLHSVFCIRIVYFILFVHTFHTACVNKKPFKSYTLDLDIGVYSLCNIKPHIKWNNSSKINIMN